MKRTLGLLLLLASALTPVAMGDAGTGYLGKDDAKSNMTCGDLTGSVGGCWGSFSESGRLTSSMQTTGTIGVCWDASKSEPDAGAQAPDPNSKTNSVTHAYYHWNNNTSQVSVNLTTTNTSTGTASRYRTPPENWHFTWAGTVDQDDPKMNTYVPATGWGAYQTIPAAWVTSDSNGTLSGSGANGTVTSSGSTGTFAASGGIGVGGGLPWGVGFKVEFRSRAAGASAANCTVGTENALKMGFDMQTSSN